MNLARWSSAIVIAIMTFFIIIIYIPPFIDFSGLNPYWNGYENFINDVNATPIYVSLDKTLPNLEAYKYTLYLIPYENYSRSELSAIKYFLDRGGYVVVLDDFGYGNQVLNYLAIPIRFDEVGVLTDPVFYYKSSKLPKIYAFNEDPVTSNISVIYMNYASGLLTLSSSVKVLAYSSIFSFIDSNGDSVYDKGDVEGPFPVAAYYPYSNGRVYVVSDPSIAINTMVNMGSNMRFLMNLSGGRIVLVDQSHIPGNIHSYIRESLFIYMKFLKKYYLLPIIISLFTLLAYILFVRKILV